FGSNLPWLTRAMVAVSKVSVRYSPLALAAIVAAVIAARRALASEAGRRFVDQTVLKIPGLGKVIARFALVRFCLMPGTLVSAVVIGIVVLAMLLPILTLQDVVH